MDVNQVRWRKGLSSEPTGVAIRGTPPGQLFLMDTIVGVRVFSRGAAKESFAAIAAHESLIYKSTACRPWLSSYAAPRLKTELGYRPGFVTFNT